MGRPRWRPNDRSICKLKPRCTTVIALKVSRDIDEDVVVVLQIFADAGEIDRNGDAMRRVGARRQDAYGMRGAQCDPFDRR